jgi:SAM-dependent methyltransferase
MTAPAATGERLDDASALYRADLARHRAAYRFAEAHARPGLAADLGCGTGYGTAELAAAGWRVVGLDRVAPVARVRGSAARFVRGDLERLPLAARGFDVVTSFQVIEHLADPRPYLEQIARILAPEGVLLLSTPNRLQSDGENPYHLHEYEAAELADVLAGHFASVEMCGVHAVGPAARYHADRLRRIRLITRIDPLGFRRRLPRGLVEWLFARLSIVVRLAARRSGAAAAVGDEHYPVGAADEECLDLLAVCRGPKPREALRNQEPSSARLREPSSARPSAASARGPSIPAAQAAAIGSGSNVPGAAGTSRCTGKTKKRWKR